MVDTLLKTDCGEVCYWKVRGGEGTGSLREMAMAEDTEVAVAPRKD